MDISRDMPINPVISSPGSPKPKSSKFYEIVDEYNIEPYWEIELYVEGIGEVKVRSNAVTGESVVLKTWFQ
jgi:hypothetical protein